MEQQLLFDGKPYFCQILGFVTKYEKRRKVVTRAGENGVLTASWGGSEIIPNDYVEYTQPGLSARLRVIARVDEILAVTPLDEAPNNEAVRLANARKRVIEPAYRAWKAGHSAPVTGTPLEMWSGITQEQAAAWRTMGINSVEQIADASSSVIDRVNMPKAVVHQTIEAAKVYLKANDRNKVADELVLLKSENERKEGQIAELASQLEELRQLMIEADANKPRRGRPPKIRDDEAEIEAA